MRLVSFADKSIWMGNNPTPMLPKQSVMIALKDFNLLNSLRKLGMLQIQPSVVGMVWFEIPYRFHYAY